MLKSRFKIILIMTSLLSVAAVTPLHASSGDTGAGFILGDPTGLTGKYFITATDAIDAGFGASYNDGFYIYGDYLFHFKDVFPVEELMLYVGFGAGFHHHDRDDDDKHRDRDDYNSLDCRVPLGVEYILNKAPLGIFFEIVPALEIIPDIDSDIKGGLGLRYYF